MPTIPKKRTYNLTFRGTSPELIKLKKLIDIALKQAVPPIDRGRPIENWGQAGGWVNDLHDNWGQDGGWYLGAGDGEVKVSQPDAALTKVTATVYEALSKATAGR
jgi:hypothetical protein